MDLQLSRRSFGLFTPQHGAAPSYVGTLSRTQFKSWLLTLEKLNSCALYRKPYHPWKDKLAVDMVAAGAWPAWLNNKPALGSRSAEGF